MNSQALTYFVFFISIIGFTKTFSQNTHIVFYNVENLFDTLDDPHTADEEFLPESPRAWNSHKYYRKLKALSKVLAACGAMDGVSLIGLAEIENRQVLDDLLYFGLLDPEDYKVVHYESPDRRGIDVAFLYKTTEFTLLNSCAIPVRFPSDTAKRTRDILYVKGILGAKDTLNLFINHWPSRWRGYLESEGDRIQAAHTLNKALRPLLDEGKHIIVMGDFNDSPTDKSIQTILDAGAPGSSKSSLYNCMWNLEKQGLGSYFYRGYWNCLDQFIVSPSLYGKEEGLLKVKAARIFSEKFLLTKDSKSPSLIPFRTYLGYRYQGGFSDHLPIVLTLEKKP